MTPGRQPPRRLASTAIAALLLCAEVSAQNPPAVLALVIGVMTRPAEGQFACYGSYSPIPGRSGSFLANAADRSDDPTCDANADWLDRAIPGGNTDFTCVATQFNPPNPDVTSWISYGIGGSHPLYSSDCDGDAPRLTASVGNGLTFFCGGGLVLLDSCDDAKLAHLNAFMIGSWSPTGGYSPTTPPSSSTDATEPPPQSSNDGGEDTGDNLGFIVAGGMAMGVVILVMAIVMIRQRAQRQPLPQVVPPVNNPAFAEPEHATMNYDEMGHVVPARRRLDEDDYVVDSNQVGGQPNALYVEPTPVGTHA